MQNYFGINVMNWSFFYLSLFISISIFLSLNLGQYTDWYQYSDTESDDSLLDDDELDSPSTGKGPYCEILQDFLIRSYMSSGRKTKPQVAIGKNKRSLACLHVLCRKTLKHWDVTVWFLPFSGPRSKSHVTEAVSNILCTSARKLCVSCSPTDLARVCLL